MSGRPPSPSASEASSRDWFDRPLSIYLDLVRFLAAAWVLLAHVQNHLAPLIPITSARDAVIIFFIMSGFLIAHAVARTPDLRSYAIARLSRVYSVVVPVLVLALALAVVGMWLDPSVYPAYQFEKLWLYLPLSLAFLNVTWHIEEPPFGVLPYWSLCYEVWYYILFGLICFCKGALRLFGILLAIAAAGFKVLMLWPIWLLGCWLYYSGRRIHLSKGMPTACVIVPLALYALMEIYDIDLWLWHATNAHFNGFDGSSLRSAKKFASDYIVAILFTIHVIGVGSLHLHWGEWAERTIRLFASCTFTVFLMHMPLVLLLESADVVDPTSLASVMTAFLGILMVSMAVGLYLERQRWRWSLLFSAMIIKIEAAWQRARLTLLPAKETS